MVEIKSIIGRGFSSNVFLVSSDEDFIVDAGLGDMERILSRVREHSMEIQRIILTHRHIDHVGNAGELSRELDAPLYAPPKEAQSLRERDDGSILASDFGIDFSPLDVEILDDKKYCGFDIITTPGHTEGSIALYHRDKGILMSGDTVFANGGAGRTDLPTGNRDQLVDSISRLNELEVESLYPGHQSVVQKNAQSHIQMALNNLNLL